MILIKTIPQFLTELECSEILNKYSNLNLEDGKFFDKELTLNKKVRDSKVTFVLNKPLEDKIINELKNHITIKGFDFVGLEKLQFTKYDVNGHYDWHTDSDDSNTTNKRYYSIVIPLNMEYNDGDLLCKDLDGNVINLEKKTGNMHIFSSSLWHKVTNVTFGVRYSLVTWLSLEKIKTFNNTLI
jgi:predicted 2-oxoglutarate/Fe(II)-dependent dioxygenase YbiX